MPPTPHPSQLHPRVYVPLCRWGSAGPPGQQLDLLDLVRTLITPYLLDRVEAGVGGLRGRGGNKTEHYQHWSKTNLPHAAVPAHLPCNSRTTKCFVRSVKFGTSGSQPMPGQLIKH